MTVLRAMMTAFATYSALPLPRLQLREEDMRYSMCFLPLVGLLIGLLWWLWAQLAQVLQVGSLLRAAGLVLLPLMVTGGIHMDGFMDTSDALNSWQPREKKLEILKDVHVGAFAVIRACMYLIALLGLYAELSARLALPAALGFVLSRCLGLLMLSMLPNARGSGMLSRVQQQQDRRVVLLAAGLFAAAAVLLGLLTDAGPLLLGLLALLLTALGFVRMAKIRFGGITGDLAGYLVQWAELAYVAGILIGGKLL